MRIKLIKVMPIVGIVDWIKALKSPAVNNSISGKAIPKISSVMTMPKIPSVRPINLPGSMSTSWENAFLKR